MQSSNFLDLPAPDLYQEPALRRSPLPDLARAPVFLLATVLLSQPWLVVLNFRSFYLMWGEANDGQKWTAALLFAFELLLLAGSSLFAWRLHHSRRPVPWAANWAIFLPHAAYLGLATWAISGRPGLIPASVSQWIVPPGTLLFQQWAFLMPALFYSALALACFPTRRGRFGDIGLSVLATAGVPALWYLGLQMARGLSLPAAFWITATIGSSLVCLAGFLRLVTGLYVWAQGASELSRSILVFLVALAGPIGGLALNAYVPFPTDFQSPLIYTIAALNGLLLLVPTTNRLEFDRAVWLGRCAMLPFTLYFFLVYLPFLPLAIPAMVLAGAGFLILVPTALLLVHARSVIAPLLAELREGWGRRGIGYALLAFGILPAAIAGGAVLDRVALARAIDHVFAPNYRDSDGFRGSRWALKRSLERARDQKQAVYLPFLTEFYDWAVFDGLTLSNPKMQTLHRAFFGRDLEFTEGARGMAFNQRRTMTAQPRGNARPVPRTVTMTNLTASSRLEDGCIVTRAVLELENHGSEVAEYVTTIAVPPGVLVSGYWLHVGQERVPGQIFERKTALWVYRMIRDVTRRDPGLLVYTSPQTLELRVFPFAAKERRVTEIEFLAPPGAAGNITIGKQTLPIGDQSAGLTLAAGANGARLVVSPQASAKLPQFSRHPYLHFIVERSARATLNPAQISQAIGRVASRFPSVSTCMVTLANYEVSDLTSEPVKLQNVGQVMEDSAGKWLPARGGFLCDRTIKRVLLRYRDAFAQASAGSRWFDGYPIIVVLGNSGNDLTIRDDDLAYFANATPDTEGFYSTNDGADLAGFGFDGQPIQAVPAPARPVHIFKCGDLMGACVAGSDESVAIDFRDSRGQKVEVFQLQAKAFERVREPITLLPNARYARGLAAWGADSAATENPSRSLEALPAIVARSRESGVLVPSTSYIVVENSAQWRMLKLKEREKLGSHKAFDFMETPEPSVVLVGLVLLFLAVIRRWWFGLRDVP